MHDAVLTIYTSHATGSDPKNTEGKMDSKNVTRLGFELRSSRTFFMITWLSRVYIAVVQKSLISM